MPPKKKAPKKKTIEASPDELLIRKAIYGRALSMYRSRCAQYLATPQPVLLKTLEKMASTGNGVASVVLEHTKLLTGDVWAFKDAFRGCLGLKALYFWSVRIPDDATAVLASFMEDISRPRPPSVTMQVLRSPIISTIQLIDCGLTSDSASALERLAACGTLENITLDHNGLGDLGVAGLLSGVARNNNVKRLGLKFTQMTDASAQNLSHVLKSQHNNIQYVCTRLDSIT